MEDQEKLEPISKKTEESFQNTDDYGSSSDFLQHGNLTSSFIFVLHLE